MISRRSTLWLLVAFLASCGSGDERLALLREPGIEAGEVKAWTAELLQERVEKDEEFATSETSPMAGTQYLKSEPAEKVFLIRDGEMFDLAYDRHEAAVLSMIRDGDSWRWTAFDQEAVCRSGDAEGLCDRAIEAPAVFSIGESRLSFYPSEDRVTFIAFDTEREEKRMFEHLLYFEPDPGLAVTAELMSFENPEKITLPTSRDLEKTFYRYATIRFLIDGEQQRLTALEGEGSAGLFVPFRDATTGIETYGAGRFLELDDPEDTIFVLDFNRAFNPLCNYSPAYNCAIPPRENRLDVAVRAGERTYPH